MMPAVSGDDPLAPILPRACVDVGLVQAPLAAMLEETVAVPFKNVGGENAAPVAIRESALVPEAVDRYWVP
jgi:hypothetical protein